jgi:hypothetical protein
MTMPHLMNCQHMEDGWCLDCVKELQKDQERLDYLATKHNGWPVLEHAGVFNDIYLHIADVMPNEWEPDGNPVPSIKMQAAFRAMLDVAISQKYAQP